MKTVVICAGGPTEELISLDTYISGDTQFIGADRGTIHLLQSGISPYAAIGDFDSVTPSEMQLIEKSGCIIDRRLAEKDETDTELALELALQCDPDRVIITGVTGGRLDHMFSAIYLLARQAIHRKKTEFIIANRQNEMKILHAGDTVVKFNANLPYLSFFSLTQAVTGITLSGVKYEVENETIHFGDTRFTSNEIVHSFCTISFNEGICLMVRSSDS